MTAYLVITQGQNVLNTTLLFTLFSLNSYLSSMLHTLKNQSGKILDVFVPVFICAFLVYTKYCMQVAYVLKPSTLLFDHDVSIIISVKIRLTKQK